CAENFCLSFLPGDRTATKRQQHFAGTSLRNLRSTRTKKIELNLYPPPVFVDSIFWTANAGSSSAHNSSTAVITCFASMFTE
ncbi:unnamed protein product, partial [Nesidiocoris tenuis]